MCYRGVSPYRRLNLHRNPFGELTREERIELAVVDGLDELVALMSQPKTAIQFIGDCGFGKSSHLFALLRELSAAEYVYFPVHGPRPALPISRPLLIDEAQRMGRYAQRSMLLNRGPIAIGTHHDLSKKLRVAGFTTTSFDVQQGTTAEHISQILNRRIKASVVDPDLPSPRVDADFAGWLADRFRSNLREIESYLYTNLQSCIETTQIWPLAT